MSINLEDKMKMNSLYDIYKELLTQKQREYFEYYFLQDYSLSEIADIFKISRNAVHMQIKNVINHLENFEKNLKIFYKNNQRKKLILEIKSKELTEEISKLISQIEKV
jgi:uncharacterized protein